MASKQFKFNPAAKPWVFYWPDIEVLVKAGSRPTMEQCVSLLNVYC
jgi:hypothetical protein